MILLRIFAAMFALAALMTANGAENLLVNPSFENSLAHWEMGGRGDAQVVWSNSTLERSDGKASIEVSNVTAAAPNVYGTIFQTVAVKPSTSYRLSLRIKAIKARYIWFGGGPGWMVRMPCPDGTYDWRTVEIIYKTLADEREFTFRICVGDLTESAWLDDLRMVEEE